MREKEENHLRVAERVIGLQIPQSITELIMTSASFGFTPFCPLFQNPRTCLRPLSMLLLFVCLFFQGENSEGNCPHLVAVNRSSSGTERKHVEMMWCLEYFSKSVGVDC